jgi:hypothetical protein
MCSLITFKVSLSTWLSPVAVLSLPSDPMLDPPAEAWLDLMSVLDDAALNGSVIGVGAESVLFVVELVMDTAEDGAPTTESSGIELTVVDFDTTSARGASGFDANPATGTFLGAGLV